MQKGYREVLKSSENTADFDASGEQLLVVKYSGSELTLSLLTPEPEPIEIPLRTFKNMDSSIVATLDFYIAEN